MQSYLAVNALIDHSNQIVRDLVRAAKTSGCNIVESRFNVLGEKLSIMLFLSGSWNEIAKLEDFLKKLEQQLDTEILMERTQSRQQHGDAMPYAVDVVGVDQPSVILKITEFMSNSDITIQDMRSNAYTATQTGAKMFSLHMTVNLSLDTSISAIRGDFIDFCDRLNLDAIMEPVK